MCRNFFTSIVYDAFAGLYIEMLIHVVMWSWCHDVMLSCCQVILLSWVNVVMFSWCHDIMLSFCHVIMLSCCLVVLLSCCHQFMFSCCHVVKLSCNHIVILSCCHQFMMTCCTISQYTMSFFRKSINIVPNVYQKNLRKSLKLLFGKSITVAGLYIKMLYFHQHCFCSCCWSIHWNVIISAALFLFMMTCCTFCEYTIWVHSVSTLCKYTQLVHNVSTICQNLIFSEIHQNWSKSVTNNLLKNPSNFFKKISQITFWKIHHNCWSIHWNVKFSPALFL